jgi:hypothetical protein
MKVIHVLRKPLSEGTVAANVLAHGTGALNIDASRIATKDDLNGGAYSAGGRRSLPGDLREGASAGMFQEGGGRLPGQYEQPAGRWPPNLILEHDPGCVCIGTKRVKGTSIHGEDIAVRRSGVHAEAGGHQAVGRIQPVRGYSDADGSEVIAAWDCAPDCPVAALDEQSGVSKSSGGRFSGGNAFGQDSGWNKTNVYRQEIERPTDTGGASRFYKQVGGQK